MTRFIIYNIIIFYLLTFYYYIVNRAFLKKYDYINYSSILVIIITGCIFCLGKIVQCKLLIILAPLIVGFIYNKFIFKRNICPSYLLSLISYLVLVIVTIVFYIIEKLFGINLSYNSLETLLVKEIIIGTAIFIIYIFKNNIFKYISFRYGNNYMIIDSSVIILCVLFIILVILRINKYQIYLMIEFSLIFLMLIGILLILSRGKTIINKNKYFAELYDSSKDSDSIITEYRMALHESNNKLLVIRGMLNGDTNTIRNYIDNAISKSITIHKDDYGVLNYIPIPAIKFFLGGKLSIIKDIGSEVELFVSPEIANIKDLASAINYWNDIYTVLGVVLDNLINSLKEASNKLCSIQVYLDGKFFHMEFANTFKDNFDVHKIAKVGYNTKKVNHGVGLFLVDNVLKKKKYYHLQTIIIDNFFVQRLRIDLSKIKIK